MLIALAMFSLGLAWFWMARISATDPWYRNTDMNIHNLADALSLNSGYSPGIVDQPAAPTKFLLALDYRLRNAAGELPTWTLKRFARSAEPLREISRLVKVGRVHSRCLVILFILLGAAYVWRVTERFDLACLATVLLCGSSGVLFHGLLVRPELLCAGFGSLLAPFALWSATTHPRPWGRALWLTATGVFLGLALLSKLPAVLYVALAAGWCALAPLLPADRGRTPALAPSLACTVGLCVAVAIATLTLTARLSVFEKLIDPTATARLRTFAAVVALLPLAAFAGARSRWTAYLSGRSLDFALLGAGILASFVGWFGLLGTVLSVEGSETYMAKILNTVIYPDPLLNLYTLPGESHRLQEALKFLAEAPILFVVTVALAGVLLCQRTAPLRLRALVFFLLAQGLGMVFLMSKRLFLEQYSLFAHTPLLLIWAIALAARDDWDSAEEKPPAARWPVALAISAAVVLCLTVSVALVPKYKFFQSDAEIPVRDLTITFLYDHDIHPPAYLQAMKQRYPTREQFAAELNRFLSDPANQR